MGAASGLAGGINTGGGGLNAGSSAATGPVSVSTPQTSSNTSIKTTAPKIVMGNYSGEQTSTLKTSDGVASAPLSQSNLLIIGGLALAALIILKRG